MWWYWAVDVLVWPAGLWLLWKAVNSWKELEKLKLPICQVPEVEE